jgi:hypothetical protein
LNSCPVFCWLETVLVLNISRTAPFIRGVRLFSLEKNKFSGKIELSSFRIADTPQQKTVAG